MTTRPTIAEAWSGRVPSLDVLRGFAALMIFLFHYVAFYPLPHESVHPVARHVIGGFFALGVPIFYCLSGLSLSLGYFEQRTEQRFLSRFYVRRLLRIAPLYYAVYLTWMTIFVSRGWWPSVGMSVTTVTFTSNLIVGYETTVVPAGWSVGVEMLFYVLFPFIIWRVTTLPRAILFWIVATGVAAAAFVGLKRLWPESDYNTKSFLSHIVYFGTGIMAYFLYRRGLVREGLRRLLAAGALLLLAVAAAWVVVRVTSRDPGNFNVQWFAHLAWSVPILLLIGFGCLTGRSWIWRRPLTWLGEWSFSVYLLHPVVLLFVTEHLKAHPVSIWSEAGRFWAWLLVSAAILLTLSWATYTFIERPGMSLGRRWAKRIAQPRTAPGLAPSPEA